MSSFYSFPLLALYPFMLRAIAEAPIRICMAVPNSYQNHVQPLAKESESMERNQVWEERQKGLLKMRRWVCGKVEAFDVFWVIHSSLKPYHVCTEGEMGHQHLFLQKEFGRFFTFQKDKNKSFGNVCLAIAPKKQSLGIIVLPSFLPFNSSEEQCATNMDLPLTLSSQFCLCLHAWVLLLDIFC